MKVTDIKSLAELNYFIWNCPYCAFPKRMEHEPKSHIYILRSRPTWDEFRKHLKKYHPLEFKEYMEEIPKIIERNLVGKANGGKNES
jgi:hypothetical protein